jgi:hypothetical protein
MLNYETHQQSMQRPRSHLLYLHSQHRSLLYTTTINATRANFVAVPSRHKAFRLPGHYCWTSDNQDDRLQRMCAEYHIGQTSSPYWIRSHSCNKDRNDRRCYGYCNCLRHWLLASHSKVVGTAIQLPGTAEKGVV